MESVDLHPVTTRPPLESKEALHAEEKPTLVTYVDWLVTCLIRAAPAELNAEYHNGTKTVLWHLRRIGSEETSNVIDSIPERYFRATLARLAFGYMGGDPYGGYRRFQLRTPTGTHRMIFHLANDSLDGFWFRGRCSSSITREEQPNSI